MAALLVHSRCFFGAFTRVQMTLWSRRCCVWRAISDVGGKVIYDLLICFLWSYFDEDKHNLSRQPDEERATQSKNNNIKTQQQQWKNA